MFSRSATASARFVGLVRDPTIGTPMIAALNNISLEMCYWDRDLDQDPLFVDRDPVPAAREITLS